MVSIDTAIASARALPAAPTPTSSAAALSTTLFVTQPLPHLIRVLLDLRFTVCGATARARLVLRPAIANSEQGRGQSPENQRWRAMPEGPSPATDGSGNEADIWR